MDTFINFISNAWTIGIGGGIVSGFIVFWVTNFFFTKREKKEYLQRVKTANNEILYAIRPLIVSQKIPEQAIIESLILSTSRKYMVNTTNLYTTQRLVEDLIKEVLDNAFLDADRKLEYCNIVNKIVNQSDKKDTDLTRDIPKTVISYEGKDTKVTEMSLILSVIAAIATLAFVLYDKNQERFIPTNLFSLLLPMAAVLMSTMLVSIFVKKKKKNIKEEEKTEEKENQNDCVTKK
jgi:hypothetical protein